MIYWQFMCRKDRAKKERGKILIIRRRRNEKREIFHLAFGMHINWNFNDEIWLLCDLLCFAENYHGSNTGFLVAVLVSVVSSVFIAFALVALCYRSSVIHKNIALCLRLVSSTQKKILYIKQLFFIYIHSPSSLLLNS